jgi:hypothetical protein
VPTDVLREVFPSEVREHLWSQTNPSHALKYRLEVLAACGPAPADPYWRDHLRGLRNQKAAWEVYLTAGFAVGLFDNVHGNDLRARLRSPNDDNFRSAMAECMSAWFLAGKLRMSLDGRPVGRPGHPLELRIKRSEGDIYVEVKAPNREIPDHQAWVGDDSDLLQEAVESSNKQFRSDIRNLLVIVPTLRISVCTLRRQITRAFFGDIRIRVPLDTGSGQPVGPITEEFNPSGHFLSRYLPSGRPFKLDSTPRFTRVSAVLCIEELPGVQQIEHSALIVHNPYAKLRISETLWGNLPQLAVRGDQMAWTDGASPWHIS